jgi:large subunit ribosomal protein L9
MELILLQKVVNLGNLGDKVNVKPGYGRNYLVPQGKAVPATAANVAAFEAKRAEYEAKAKAMSDEAESRRGALDGVSITIKANASTEGKLYGSVGPRDIAEALTAAGYKVGKSEVIMGEGPLRHIGEHEVLVHLHADVEVPVKVVVEPEAA